jgi:hypothetical protein
MSLLKWLSKDRGDASVDNHTGGKRKRLSAEEEKLDVKFQVATGTSAVQMESINNTQSQQDTEYPDCWSVVQYKYFTEENKWLVLTNKKLGCSICAEVSKLGMGPQSGVGVKPSRDWANCEVSYFGNTKETAVEPEKENIGTQKDSLS